MGPHPTIKYTRVWVPTIKYTREILLTAVGMFSPRWECSHRGGNVSTSVEILLTAVGMFSPRWECSHRGGNVLTAVI